MELLKWNYGWPLIDLLSSTSNLPSSTNFVLLTFECFSNFQVKGNEAKLSCFTLFIIFLCLGWRDGSKFTLKLSFEGQKLAKNSKYAFLISTAFVFHPCCRHGYCLKAHAWRGLKAIFRNVPWIFNSKTSSYFLLLSSYWNARAQCERSWEAGISPMVSGQTFNLKRNSFSLSEIMLKQIALQASIWTSRWTWNYAWEEFGGWVPHIYHFKFTPRLSSPLLMLNRNERNTNSLGFIRVC